MGIAKTAKKALNWLKMAKISYVNQNVRRVVVNAQRNNANNVLLDLRRMAMAAVNRIFTVTQTANFVHSGPIGTKVITNVFYALKTVGHVIVQTVILVFRAITKIQGSVNNVRNLVLSATTLKNVKDAHLAFI